MILEVLVHQGSEIIAEQRLGGDQKADKGCATVSLLSLLYPFNSRYVPPPDQVMATWALLMVYPLENPLKKHPGTHLKSHGWVYF